VARLTLESVLMISRIRSAAAVLLTLATAACSPDRTSAPPTTLDARQGHAALQTSVLPAPTPVSISIFPNEVVGGTGTSTIRVDVDSAVACCDRTMQVTSNNASVLPFLSSATTVAAGTTFAAVQLLPAQVSQQTVVTVTVTGNGIAKSVDLIVDPPGTAIAPTLSSYIVNPGTVAAGARSTGTVFLPSPAPSGGVLVSLASRIPASASVPPSVTVPPGALSVSFPITTFPGFPNSTTSVLLTAITANTLVSSSITVITGSVPAPTLALSSLALNPASVVGGNSSQGTVTMSGAVPSNGAVVQLTSGNVGVATTPSNVFIPGGKTSATFPITTTALASSTNVAIFATFGGNTRTATLTVNPSSATPPSTGLSAPTLLAPSADQRFTPGTNITFDWSDVTGAASYEVQIDDKDTFPSPLTLDQRVTASQLSTAALPTRTLFWRVRAVSSTGVAGGWSTVRRFELKQ
jgi:hypothetical protein